MLLALIFEGHLEEKYYVDILYFAYDQVIDLRLGYLHLAGIYVIVLESYKPETFVNS